MEEPNQSKYISLWQVSIHWRVQNIPCRNIFMWTILKNEVLWGPCDKFLCGLGTQKALDGGLVCAKTSLRKSLELHLWIFAQYYDDQAIIQFSRALGKGKTLTKFQLYRATNPGVVGMLEEHTYIPWKMLQANFFMLQKTLMVFHPEILQPKSKLLGVDFLKTALLEGWHGWWTC